MYKISIDSGKDNFVSFEQGDIVKAQKFTGNDIRLTVLEVVKVESDHFFGTLIDGVAPVVGMVFIRLDNTQDDDRKGAIVLSATGSNTPFIDFLFGQVTTTRIGDVNGVTDPTFPTLGGNGLYSENVFLKGEFVLTDGENINVKFDEQGALIQANENAIIVNSDGIVLRALQTDLDTTDINVGNNLTAIGVNAGNINLRVEKDDVINQINISTEGIVIAADNIEISGATTFIAGYDPTDKLDLLDAGDLATLDVAEVTDLGTTVIVGGFLKTDLIDVNTLIAENIKTSASGQRVEITSASQTLRFYDSSDDLILDLDGPNKQVKLLENGQFIAFGDSINVSLMNNNEVSSTEFTLNNNKLTANVSNNSFYRDSNIPNYKNSSGQSFKILNNGTTKNRSIGGEVYTWVDGILIDIV